MSQDVPEDRAGDDPIARLAEPMTIGNEAYVSRDYARAEQDRLWRRVWQMAGRVEELPDVGSYLTYEIMDDSILIVRTSPDEIAAYHNVCPHRGRRLEDCGPRERNACGRAQGFACRYHGWSFDLEGRNTHIPYADDWQGSLDAAQSSLAPVALETWGGWIFVNMDPDCGPLREYLAPIPEMLDPFGLDRMRYRWRKWGVFPCNWKVAMEAFNETYHVQTTHPEFNRFGSFRGWARSHGLHTHIGYDTAADADENQKAKLRVATEGDARVETAFMQDYIWEKANTNTTQTLVDAARRLVDELPEGTPTAEVQRHWIESARRDDEARGVVWASVDPAHVAKTGTAWQIFPNFQIGHAVNNMLCYSARPYGDDPDQCIFEAAVYELFPEGEAPKTEWEFCPPTEEAWCYVLAQDFSNMAAVQQGMKSAGFRGTRPNPYMERSTVSLHHNLARYMGAGAPRKVR